MKTKYIISTIALTGVLALTGCEDFLEQKNTHDLNQQTFFDSEAALRAATAPLYNYVWAGFNGQSSIMEWAMDVPTTSPPNIPTTSTRTPT